jgi:hypothetical protein
VRELVRQCYPAVTDDTLAPVGRTGAIFSRDPALRRDSPASFLDDGPTSKLIGQILGGVAEFDKAVTVAKLKRGT